jgi:hypothetical protein
MQTSTLRVTFASSDCQGSLGTLFSAAVGLAADYQNDQR